MFAYICTILESFRPAFSRRSAFSWFAALVVGFLVRSDKLGITSVVRDLLLRPASYLSLLHFFRAGSWSLGNVRQCWYRAILRHVPLLREDGSLLLAADGVKQSKEARKMPAVKRLHQESETQSKPDVIFGHMWGCVGVLAGFMGKLACLPASLRIHDGIREAASWEGSDVSDESHVVQTIRNCCEVARAMDVQAIALLDRYFLSVPALLALGEENGRQGCALALIAKAKKSCIAYHEPAPRKAGQRGRPRRKGDKVKLDTLFDRMAGSFQRAKIEMYGEMREVCYHSIVLLWGQSLYCPLRFVLVKCGQTRSILACTRTDLAPETIIRLYSYRFRIEHTFRELKQQLGCFAYRFWTKAMPKLSHFRKKGTPSPLAEVKEPKERARILGALRAIEMHALVASIAMGILQALSLGWTSPSPQPLRWQRTPCGSRPSEANVMHVLRRSIFTALATASENSILHFIRKYQAEPFADGHSEAA